MAITLEGPFKILPYVRDDEGHREYHILHQVRTTTPLQGNPLTGDGPESIAGAAGLPQIGDTWSYGNDSDPWAICTPRKIIKPLDPKKGDPDQFYSVENIFSTRPLGRCQDDPIGDPLLEPQKVKGGSVRYTIEAIKDRFGNPLMSSSHEMFRGPQVEFDGGRDQVIIEQNVADLELGLITSLRNKLNDDTLWSLVARRIKLSDVSWEQLWYGVCTFYYKRIFVFDIRNGVADHFDRDILDEGTKVLKGRWVSEAECIGTGVLGGSIWVDVEVCGAAPDKTNPQHFARYKDVYDENARVILDGKGRPAATVVGFGTGEDDVPGTGTDATDDAYTHHFEYYEEGDLTQLNIPTDLDFGTAT